MLSIWSSVTKDTAQVYDFQLKRVKSHSHIGRLDITVNESLRMKVLYNVDDLLANVPNHKPSQLCVV